MVSKAIMHDMALAAFIKNTLISLKRIQAVNIQSYYISMISGLKEMVENW